MITSPIERDLVLLQGKPAPRVDILVAATPDPGKFFWGRGDLKFLESGKSLPAAHTKALEQEAKEWEVS